MEIKKKTMRWKREEKVKKKSVPQRERKQINAYSREQLP
jgi:hypothetical protein